VTRSVVSNTTPLDWTTFLVRGPPVRSTSVPSRLTVGENTNNGQRVACKIIDMSKIDNEVTEYLLHNEKKALELLQHPNVIHTLDIFQ